MAHYVTSAVIMLSIPIVCLITEVLIRRFLKTNCAEIMYCVMPIGKDTADIEMKLISMKSKLDNLCCGNFTVFITDFGADDTTRKICEKYCCDNHNFVLINPELLEVLITPQHTL